MRAAQIKLKRETKTSKTTFLRHLLKSLEKP
jgi:hypothetical protein